MIYLDTSALLKLVHEEPESGALEVWLRERERVPVATSEVARVELIRACRRVDPAALPGARALLLGVDLVPVSTTVLEAASEVGDVTLRSLDALHLASALVLQQHLSSFLAYDRRLLDAAEAAGLPTSSPV